MKIGSLSAAHAIGDADLVSRVETMVATDMDGEIIMMSVERGQYFHFDDIATEIWRCLSEPRRFDEIVAHLLELYDVTVEECRHDTEELIAMLRDVGVLRVVQP